MGRDYVIKARPPTRVVISSTDTFARRRPTTAACAWVSVAAGPDIL